MVAMELEILGMNFGCVLAALSDAKIPDKGCLLPLISKLLGYAIVAASTTVKLPQVPPPSYRHSLKVLLCVKICVPLCVSICRGARLDGVRGDLKSYVLCVSIACGTLHKGSAVGSFAVSLARRGKRAGKSRG
jgi:hypothetical protein